MNSSQPRPDELRIIMNFRDPDSRHTAPSGTTAAALVPMLLASPFFEFEQGNGFEAISLTVQGKCIWHENRRTVSIEKSTLSQAEIDDACRVHGLKFQRGRHGEG